MPRKNKKKKKAKKAKGHNRNQPVLRMPKAGPRFNLQCIFMHVVESFYLENLDPPVDEETDTALAVRLHMCEPATVKKMIAMVSMSCVHVLPTFCMSFSHVLPTCIVNICMVNVL